jgi:hypothetical protein
MSKNKKTARFPFKTRFLDSEKRKPIEKRMSKAGLSFRSYNSFILSAILLMYSGLVPQHPPMTLAPF